MSRPGRLIPGAGRLLGAVILWSFMAVRPARAQQSQILNDTFGDSAVARLVERAMKARGRDVSGIQSYEGVMREHLYVGLSLKHFRRERGLFEQERVARFRWSANGKSAIEWIGARRAVPILGADTRRDALTAEGGARRAGGEVLDSLPEELLNDTHLPFGLDPSGDRLLLGEHWALNPLADTALSQYRYFWGDTLRLSIPSEKRDVVLYEVKVEPRHADFHLVAGSLWFDAQTASLVRATYKPARPFDLSLDEPGDAEDVPGLLKPVQAEISYMSVEYSLYDFRYWLPRRFAFQGEVRMGGLVRMPLLAEWTVKDYRVNETRSAIPSLDTPLPPGWSRRVKSVGDSANPRYVTVIVPPADSVLTSPVLSADFGQRGAAAFTSAEVKQLRGELESLLPTHTGLRPQVAWGLKRDLVRYNRVEGLSAGLAVTVPLDPMTDVDAQVRMGTADRILNGTLSFEHGPEEGRWSVRAYRQLRSMSDWSDPFNLKSSLDGLVLGRDRGQYYRATGVAVSHDHQGFRVKSDFGVFHEREGSVHLGTRFFLLQGMRDITPAPVLSARDVTLTGVRGSVSWFSGIDPARLIVTGSLSAEAAVGDARYQRAAVVGSVSHPLFLGLSGALEAGAGTTWGDDLVQRHFFLGGSSTLRGFDANSVEGRTFWRVRGEVGGDFPGARLTAFSDVGWAGARSDVRLDGSLVSVGVGGSFLDGLVRVDLARAVRGASGWKLMVYLDGLM